MTDSCLIIGGNSGIGAKVANDLQDYFVENGYKNLIMAPDHIKLDVTRSSLVRGYLMTHGPFRYIVYSAGFNQLSWIKDLMIRPTLNYTFDVNVGGFISIVSEHLDIWPDAKVSAVAVSSDAATNPMRGSLAYCASKAALDMTIRVMARELAPLWRVNGVAPGMVEGTPMTEYIDKTIPEFRGWSPDYAREYERSSVPTGRRATLEEVSETIRWVLFGPDQMTGEIVKINGGKL